MMDSINTEIAMSAIKTKPPVSVRDRYIDRGPAWMSAIWTFAIIGMHYGLLTCGSLYYQGMMEAFNYPISIVSWLVTGQFAIAFCLSPFYHRILERVPELLTVCVAISATSLGIVISTYMENYFAFMVLYTIIGGIGLGMSVLRPVAIMAEYFDRYRILALAMASSASGMGTFVYSALGSFLIETYTWRVGLMGIGLLHLNLIPLTLLLRHIPKDPITESIVILPDDRETGVSKEHLDSALFSSMMSIQSRNIGRAEHNADNTRIHIAPSQDLQAVIEYVKVTHSRDEPMHIIVSPITFMTDPGVVVLDQISEAAREYWQVTQDDPDSEAAENAVLVPVVFLHGEPGQAALAAEIRRRCPRTEQSDALLASNMSLGLELACGSMGTLVRRPVAVGDSYASAILVSHDRRQMRREVREVITQADRRVEQCERELVANGNRVCHGPIWTVIDQSKHLEAETQFSGNAPTSERVCVLGYHGPDEAPIPEEGEQDSDSYKTVPYTHTSTTSRGHSGSTMEESSERSHSFNLRGLLQKPDDLITSVMSLAGPTEAVDVIVSKFERNTRMAEDEQIILIERRKLPAFLLADPLLLTFLLSRSFCFLTDSVMFAHLSNFAIAKDIPSDTAAGLLSYVGIMAMVGRFLMGLVAQFGACVDIRTLAGVSLVLAGFCLLLIPFFPTVAALSAMSFIYGSFVSPSFAFAPGITHQIVGSDRYGEGVSFLFQFEAIGFLVGGPIGGLIKELTNRYMDCFIFGAVADFCAGTILLTQALLDSYQCTQTYHRLNKRKQSDATTISDCSHGHDELE